MISYLTSCDSSKRNLAPSRVRGRRIGSALRVLAFALALLVTTTSVVFADHMGNHERPVEESTSDCGEEAAELDNTAVYGPGTGEVFSAESPDDGVLSATEATEPAVEDETAPARRFDSRP